MLTPAQLTTLKAAILADPILAAYGQDADSAYAVAAAFSAPSSYAVWASSVSRDEVTGDGMDWTQVDNLTVGQARIWDWLFDNDAKRINASDPGKRAGVSEAWKGTAAKVAVAAFVLGKCKRNANRIEALLATGTGTTASPGTMNFEGSLSYVDIYSAWGA